MSPTRSASSVIRVAGSGLRVARNGSPMVRRRVSRGSTGQAGLLEHHADAGAQLAERAVAGDALPVEPLGAGGGLVQQREQPC